MKGCGGLGLAARRTSMPQYGHISVVFSVGGHPFGPGAAHARPGLPVVVLYSVK